MRFFGLISTLKILKSIPLIAYLEYTKKMNKINLETSMYRISMLFNKKLIKERLDLIK